ncbi:MAG: virulence protein RhuM/Fic/DOC family protein [Desulfobulbaceae bacterium]|nr:virulence protein RhuM/Fic/DOC family protein [Desulfobulbaceae bacterium]
MMEREFDHGEIILYESEDGRSAIDVHLKDETVWLTQADMVTLFERDQSVISRHVNNVFKEGELQHKSNMQKMHIANSDKPVVFYSLDVIISVGYRVKSKRGTQFRIWATSVLKDHLVKGYTYNQRRLAEKGTEEVQQVLALLTNTLASHELVNDEGRGVLDIINRYAKTWQLLLQYDEETLSVPKSAPEAKAELELPAARSAILSLKKELAAKNEATELFGQERGHGLEGIIGAIHQTFGGQDLYPGVILKAAHLLYFVIKDHPFSDGNKRIGTFLFLLFLRQNGKLNEYIFSNNALVALALLTAASDPGQKDIMIKLIVNLISDA